MDLCTVDCGGLSGAHIVGHRWAEASVERSPSLERVCDTAADGRRATAAVRQLHSAADNIYGIREEARDSAGRPAIERLVFGRSARGPARYGIRAPLTARRLHHGAAKILATTAEEEKILDLA